MSILRDTQYSIYYGQIYDWIVSPPTDFVKDLYGIHRRFNQHAHSMTKILLRLFFRLTVVNDFVLMNSARENIRTKPIRVEAEVNALEEWLDSEWYFSELLAHDTRSDALDLEAFIEDKGICVHPKAWIGYAYCHLWPFLAYPYENSPGIHSWREGKRIIQSIRMIPILSMSIAAAEDSIYS